MKIIDISMDIHEDMPVYKNKQEKKPLLARTRTIEQGANESKITLDLHTGTHADAFYHMTEAGRTIDQMDLDAFIGSCLVLDFTKEKTITRESIIQKKKIIKKLDIILLKTRAAPLQTFNPEFCYLDSSGASYLAKKRVKCVGIDTLGIERNQPGHETHTILFRNSVAIVEGLELSKVKEGRYFFIGAPLKIVKGDASPIRAFLIDKKP